MKYKLFILFLVLLLLTNSTFATIFPNVSKRAYANEIIDKNTALLGLIASLGTGFLLNIYSDAPRIEDKEMEIVDLREEDIDEYSSKELQQLLWLGQIITGEARGEPYEGKVAVAAVVLNRVEHPGFPDTVYDVIHAERQFAAISDRQAFLQADDTAYQAAREAMNGRDPTGGAIFFYNPDPALHSSGIDWLQNNTTKLGRIGGHVFAK